MSAPPRSIRARIAQLESSLQVQRVECEMCGYPVTQPVCAYVITKDDSPLPTCESCGRVLHPQTGQPIGKPFTRLIGVDPDRV